MTNLDVLSGELETILLREDLDNRASVHCLACRQRLGSLAYVERHVGDGSTETALAVSIQPELLDEFHQGPQRVSLLCSCGRRSTYHLLVT